MKTLPENTQGNHPYVFISRRRVAAAGCWALLIYAWPFLVLFAAVFLCGQLY